MDETDKAAIVSGDTVIYKSKCSKPIVDMTVPVSLWSLDASCSAEFFSVLFFLKDISVTLAWAFQFGYFFIPKGWLVPTKIVTWGTSRKLNVKVFIKKNHLVEIVGNVLQTMYFCP